MLLGPRRAANSDTGLGAWLGRTVLVLRGRASRRIWRTTGSESAGRLSPRSRLAPPPGVGSPPRSSASFVRRRHQFTGPPAVPASRTHQAQERRRPPRSGPRPPPKPPCCARCRCPLRAAGIRPGSHRETCSGNTPDDRVSTGTFSVVFWVVRVRSHTSLVWVGTRHFPSAGVEEVEDQPLAAQPQLHPDMQHGWPKAPSVGSAPCVEVRVMDEEWGRVIRLVSPVGRLRDRRPGGLALGLGEVARLRGQQLLFRVSAIGASSGRTAAMAARPWRADRMEAGVARAELVGDVGAESRRHRRRPSSTLPLFPVQSTRSHRTLTWTTVARGADDRPQERGERCGREQAGGADGSEQGVPFEPDLAACR